jgi:hypothetical protein
MAAYDSIQSKAATRQYQENWERIFGDKDKTETEMTDEERKAAYEKEMNEKFPGRTATPKEVDELIKYVRITLLTSNLLRGEVREKLERLVYYAEFKNQQQKDNDYVDSIP